MSSIVVSVHMQTVNTHIVEMKRRDVEIGDDDVCFGCLWTGGCDNDKQVGSAGTRTYIHSFLKTCCIEYHTLIKWPQPCEQRPLVLPRGSLPPDPLLLPTPTSHSGSGDQRRPFGHFLPRLDGLPSTNALATIIRLLVLMDSAVEEAEGANDLQGVNIPLYWLSGEGSATEGSSYGESV